MKEIKIKGRVRKGVGKKIAHKLRASGEVPGILYGHKEEPIALAVPEHDLWYILHKSTSENLILSLSLSDNGGEPVTALIRDVQHHPVTGDILHVDLQRISLNEKLNVGVPLKLEGVPRGVKEFGGILDQVAREIVVYSTPREIPEFVSVTIEEMEIGDSIHLEDIVKQYPDIEFAEEPEMMLAHISPPPKKIEVATEEVAEEEEVEEGEEEVEEVAEEGEGEEKEEAEKEES
jgi:large subunit ribosomal protein L25